MAWQTRLPQAMLFVAALLLLIQCGPTRQIYWVNPQFGPEIQQQRFTLDSTECAALANQLIPDPPPPPESQSGTFWLDTPKGPVHGTYRNQPSFSGGGLLGGWLKGERENARRDYAAACMANRGWQQRVVEQ